MPATTPIYALPYPTGSDTLQDAVTTIPHSLASQLESTLQGWGGIAAPAAWVAAPLTAQFANYGSGYQTARYRKVGAQVFVEGMVTNGPTAQGANVPIFTLPVGFRPLAQRAYMVDVNAAAARLTVTAAGVVAAQVALPANSTIALFLPVMWID